MSSDGLAEQVRRGLMWSATSTLVLRLGSLVVGVALARLLAPEEFGVYAIALTLQAILITFADLGLSSDLVRADDPRRRAPTVATLTLVTSALFALTLTLAAGPLASVMGAAEAASVIMVLGWTLVPAGAGVVPYAKLTRDIQQQKLFACAVLDFAVGTAVTLTLVVLGLGPIALAIGRLTAQVAATTFQFVLARVRPRFGFDRAIAASALAFGAPLAGANVLSIVLVNLDNVVIAQIAGTTALGFYVLAFNVSSWPMSAIGQPIRSVALAGFAAASRRRDGGGLETALALAWAAALGAGVLLAALAEPLVVFLYGSRWSAAATVLAALGLFGAVRVVLDLFATYLAARGAARQVLYVQLLWCAGLIPAVVIATHSHGIAGAGWAHLATAVLVVLPGYAVALHGVGVSARSLVRATWLPTLAALPAWLVAHTVAAATASPATALLAGGSAGAVVYCAPLVPWVRRQLAGSPRHDEPAPAWPLDKPHAEVAA